MVTVTVSELKAKCLAIVDGVSRTGEAVLVTKRGRPIARVIPAASAHGTAGLIGTVEITGDIDSPVLPPETWEVEAARAE